MSQEPINPILLKMAIVWALSGDRTMIDDMEIRRNNVAMPVEVWGNTSFDEKGDVAYAIATFRTLPSANKQRNYSPATTIP